MKVAISFTLDVDRDGWAEEFSVSAAEVREDVRAYFEASMEAHLRDTLGLHAEQAVQS